MFCSLWTRGAYAFEENLTSPGLLLTGERTWNKKIYACTGHKLWIRIEYLLVLLTAALWYGAPTSETISKHKMFHIMEFNKIQCVEVFPREWVRSFWNVSNRSTCFRVYNLYVKRLVDLVHVMYYSYLYTSIRHTRPWWHNGCLLMIIINIIITKMILSLQVYDTKCKRQLPRLTVFFSKAHKTYTM